MAKTMTGAIQLVSVVIPVRNPTVALASLLESLYLQVLPTHTDLEITVVDDGSACAVTMSSLPASSCATVRVIRRHPGGNRSAARNAGARASQGSVVVFLDADCRPVTRRNIEHFCDALVTEGVSCAGGPIHGGSHGFWGRYQNDLQLARQRRKRGAVELSLTAANLAVRRDAFLDVGGFDEDYRGYGFEDRDLILKLAARGKLVWLPEVAVNHEDAILLRDVAQKLCEAGAQTAQRFSATHPTAYRSLGYASMDATLHQWLAPIAPLVGNAAFFSAPHIDRWLTKGLLPYSAGKLLVKLVSAASFLYGTNLRNRSL